MLNLRSVYDIYHTDIKKLDKVLYFYLVVKIINNEVEEFSSVIQEKLCEISSRIIDFNLDIIFCNKNTLKLDISDLMTSKSKEYILSTFDYIEGKLKVNNKNIKTSRAFDNIPSFKINQQNNILFKKIEEYKNELKNLNE